MRAIEIRSASTSAPTRKKRGAASLQETFDRYWRLVDQRQRRNESLMATLLQLRARYEAEVLPAERVLNEAIAQQCFHLMDLCSLKGLPGDVRMALIEWLNDNADSLEAHPYFPAADKQRLRTAIADCLQQQAPKPRKRRQPRPAPADADEPLDRAAFAGDEEQQSASRFAGSDADAADSSDDDLPTAADIPLPDSINRLFRRLAKVLHPDMEQDAAMKQQKHELMSRLLKAREQNDLPTLLALYGEHVTGERVVVEEAELRGYVAMLKQQLDRLDAEQQQLVSQDAVTFMTWQWCHDSTPRQIDANIRRHLQGVAAALHDCRLFVTEVRTARQLRQYLEAFNLL